MIRLSKRMHIKTIKKLRTGNKWFMLFKRNSKFEHFDLLLSVRKDGGRAISICSQMAVQCTKGGKLCNSLELQEAILKQYITIFNWIVSIDVALWPRVVSLS